jgi:hypothetical protein
VRSDRQADVQQLFSSKGSTDARLAAGDRVPTQQAGEHCDVIDPSLLYVKFLNLQMMWKSTQIWVSCGGINLALQL